MIPASGYRGGGAPFYTMVLTDLGAPVTADDLAFLERWGHYEGTAARNNPMATTRHARGSWRFNWKDVQSYPTAEIGAQATADTLDNGLYPEVVAGLRSGHPWSDERVRAEVNVWGTHGFARWLS